MAAVTLDQLANSYAAAAEALKDWTPAMNLCGLILRNDVLANFAGSHGPDGTPWAPLADGSGRPPLRRSWRLLQSFAGGADGVYEVTPNSVTVGTTVPYAAIHQRGATIPARRRGRGEKPYVFRGRGGELVFTRRVRAATIPARPFEGISTNALERMRKVLAVYLRTGKAVGA